MTSTERPEYHDVVIVGAGVSGIGMAAQLKRNLGVTDVRIVDREAGQGGTWWANTYPGCACDIPATLYSFSFAQKKDWSTFYPGQGELRKYITDVCHKFELDDKFLFRHEVRCARWDEATRLWNVELADLSEVGNDRSLSPGSTNSEVVQTAKTKHFVCRVFISAVGGLCVPNELDVPGVKDFKGPLFHSARWDHSVDMKDKNVIVVGNGCSATQFVPVVADEAKTLTQFVRSKHWYFPQPTNPFRSAFFQWMIRHVPGFNRLQRFLVYLACEFMMLMMFERWGKLYREKWANDSRKYIRKNAPKKYHELLIPKNGELKAGCKRRVFDTGYIPCLNRSNVRLEPSKLVQIKEHSVITGDGREIPADVIVLANGFNVHGMGYPMKVYGKGGKTVQDHWEDFNGPVAYRGTMLSNFPNFFSLMGPNTGTGHLSVIFTVECQMGFIVTLLQPILQSRPPKALTTSDLPEGQSTSHLPIVEVKAEAVADEQVWLQEKVETMVFAPRNGCGSWYIDKASGKVTAIYPDWQFRFWQRSAFPVWRDLVYSDLPGGATRPKGSFIQRIGCSLGLGELSAHSKASSAKKVD